MVMPLDDAVDSEVEESVEAPVAPTAPRASATRCRGPAGFFADMLSSDAQVEEAEAAPAALRRRPSALSCSACFFEDSYEGVDMDDSAGDVPILEAPRAPRAAAASSRRCFAASSSSELLGGSLLQRRRPIALEDDLDDAPAAEAPPSPAVPSAPTAAARRCFFTTPSMESSTSVASSSGFRSRRPVALDEEHEEVDEVALEAFPAAPRHGAAGLGLLALRIAPNSLDLEIMDFVTEASADAEMPSAPRARDAGSLRNAFVEAPRYLKKPPALHTTADLTSMPASPRHSLPPPSPTGRFVSPRARMAGTASKLLLPPSATTTAAAATASKAPQVSAMSLDLAGPAAAGDSNTKYDTVAAVNEASADAKVRFVTPVEWTVCDGTGRVPFSAASDVSRLLPPIAASKRSLTPTPRTVVAPGRSAAADWQVI